MTDKTARAEVMQAERRRRDTTQLGGRRRRMMVSEALLDRENYVYRFVNDEPGRLHDLTVNDDWDVVADRAGTMKADGAGTGAEVAVQVGRGTDGRAVKAILLRKPKALHAEDEKAKQRLIDEQELSIKSGATPGTDRDKAYVPQGGIRLEHGSRS